MCVMLFLIVLVYALTVWALLILCILVYINTILANMLV
jgi:hypothetical protein